MLYAGVLLKQTHGGILHQPFGVSAFLGDDPRKLRFLLRGENGLPSPSAYGKTSRVAGRGLLIGNTWQSC
jgi:hypothetical protein